jgi:hypothetical protein
VIPVNIVLAYKNRKTKDEEVAAATATQRDAAKAAHTISSAVKHWPATKPCVGLISSPLSDAVSHQQGQNEWHMVAMARQGNDVWVHDPSYNAEQYKDKERRRIADVGGTKMVQELVAQWPQVRGVWFQGPPKTYEEGKQECLGRSAMWDGTNS